MVPLGFSWTFPQVCKMAAPVRVVLFSHNHIHKQVAGLIRIIRERPPVVPLFSKRKNISEAPLPSRFSLRSYYQN